MRCPRCQHENPPQAKFCPECGARLALTCAKCHAELPPSPKFCPECGEPVAQQIRARFSSPESYTPRYLAEKILTSKTALEGERKHVTVLFADLKGSMELLADRDPEEARKILDPVLQKMREAVHHYEGTVNQVMGDGIMALFGAPLAHEDHAVRACYAALRMQESGARAEDAQRSREVPMIRVGLNSGEVVVRSIGSDLHMDYTAVGQTTHLAARMEQMASPGSIWITRPTLQLAEGFVEVNLLGSFTVKGLASPIEVFELIGTSEVRSRLQATAVRGLTTYIGRRAELDQLRQTMTRARIGYGQVIAVIGEPGIGKSRLAWEVTHSESVRGWLVVEGSAVSYGRTTPYLPIIEMLRAYFQIEMRDTAEEILDKVTGKLRSLGHALEPFLSPLLFLLDIPHEDPGWEELDPPRRRARILEAIRSLFIRESQRRPVLLIVENLHWVDDETQAVLDILVDSLPGFCILLFVNYRPNYEHGWAGKAYYTQIRLDPLPSAHVSSLLDYLLGEDDALAGLKQALINRAQGNPFFLEEIVRTLVETRVLAGEPGQYRLAQPLGSIQVPATVQAMLAARIDRLAPQEKSLLQSAAVIGKDAPLALLQGIAELPDEALRGGLSRLQAAEFLYETSVFPDSAYTFKHALTHEVAYGTLLQNQRRGLHVRILQAIEKLHADRLLEHVERLADHAFRGEAWEKAVTYLRQAGMKSLARSAHRQAITYLGQALTTLTHLPRTRDTLEQTVDLHLEIRNALVALGEITRTLGHLREAEVLAESLGDRRRLGRVLVFTASQLWLMGRPDKTVETGLRAVAFTTEIDDVALRAGARFTLALGYQALGDYRRAIECLNSSLQSLEGDQAYDRRAGIAVVSVLCHAWLVWCLTEIGEFADAFDHARKALQIAEVTNQPANLVFAHRALGLAHLRKGELEQAIPALEEALALCRGAELRIPFDVTAGLLGHAYTRAGRVGEALLLMEQAVSDPASTGSANHPLLFAYLSEGYLVGGDVDRAVAVAKRALDLARQQKEGGNEGWVVRLFGEIAVLRDSPDCTVAEQCYRDALDRAAELGMRPLIAHCHLGFGKLYGRKGKRVQALDHLATATTMYHEMDMHFWLEQAEAELRGLQ